MARRKRRRIRLAWGDESMRTQDSGPGRYMVGVTLCNLDETAVRDGFEEHGLFHQKKAHWYNMTDPERRKSVDFINGLGLRHVVVCAEPLPHTIRPERARRKCLETLLPILEHQYGVDRLFMEARNPKQDRQEMLFVQGIRSRGFIKKMDYDLLTGRSDARLWLPDQVLGVMGADDWQGPVLNDCETYTIGVD
ncbi:hypothetical protein OZX72_08215 [Bifidobacterium sp. ESL0769]|uniref:hypothetical protein n=1 Tax=Bifidobacterium sp. ESL0769 TaxID=2983229 RepID=UPI0023F6B789|nr:hypothetical protein [Bifidobacterium sp. ESL0769]WEV67208.1 hypothetical protein OZX72_08215 [Bifidobacterium sp. ESL0769]